MFTSVARHTPGKPTALRLKRTVSAVLQFHLISNTFFVLRSRGIGQMKHTMFGILTPTQPNKSHSFTKRILCWLIGVA